MLRILLRWLMLKFGIFQRYFQSVICYANILRRNVTLSVAMADVEIWIFSKTFPKVSFVTAVCYGEMLRILLRWLMLKF